MSAKEKLEKRIEDAPKLYMEKKRRGEERLWNKIRNEPKIKAANRKRKRESKEVDEKKKKALFRGY